MPLAIRTRGRARAIFVACALAASLSAGGVFAWQTSVRVSARVWGHHFHEVALEQQGCKVVARIAYEAPEVAYENPAAERNHYRFKARVRLQSGRVVTSQAFESTAPGKHSAVVSTDTKNQGCWAKERQGPLGIDVEGCRGTGCKIKPFD